VNPKLLSILFFNSAVLIFNSRMNISIEHIGLPAADSVVLKNWYERVLGARAIWNNGQVPPTYLLELGQGAWLEIYPANDLPNTGRADNKCGGFRHLALRVDSLAATKVELEKRGVTFTEPVRPAAGAGNVLFFADAEGNLLHLVARPNGWKP
jgi:catechol 2,3-dioxygenase-like lactoylglutathione lyase family enzyme